MHSDLRFASEVGMNNSDTTGGAFTATKILITSVSSLHLFLSLSIFYFLRDNFCGSPCPTCLS